MTRDELNKHFNEIMDKMQEEGIISSFVLLTMGKPTDEDVEQWKSSPEGVIEPDSKTIKWVHGGYPEEIFQCMNLYHHINFVHVCEHCGKMGCEHEVAQGEGANENHVAE